MTNTAARSIVPLLLLASLPPLACLLEKGFHREMTAPARILSRRVLPKNPLIPWSRWRCRVVFSLPSGRRLQLSANEFDYRLLKEGRSGLLTWRGGTFLDFETDQTD